MKIRTTHKTDPVGVATGPGTVMDAGERRWLWLLLLIGFVFRLYASVYFTCSTDTDVATNAMMVRHIAEGRHVPVFFYNQAYLGTLEAYVGALFYRVMEHSLLPPLLGSALISFLALPFFYFWARRGFGVSAARLGLMLLLMGPPEFFFRNVFLGYPIALLCGMAACWLTLRVIDRLKQNTPIRFDAILLGLVAGLGWWNNTLTIAFFAPCGLMIVLCSPWRRWIRLLPLGLAGGLLGASPWIVYSLRHADALAFASDVSVMSGKAFGHNIYVALRMILTLAGGDGSGHGLLGWAACGVVLVLVAVSVKSLAGRVQASQWMPWLIIATTVAICGISSRFGHVPAVRYLLPVVPAMAVLAGAGAEWITRRFTGKARWLAPLGIGIILLSQFMQLPNYWSKEHQAGAQATQNQVEQLTAFCKEKGLDALYGNFFLQWMSYASDERLKITSFPYYFDRYRPYRASVSLATNLAVMNDYSGLSRFLLATGGQAHTDHAGGVSLQWDIRREARPVVPIPVEDVASIRWETDEAAGNLMDDNLDTPLSYGQIDREPPLTRERTLCVRLNAFRRIAGIQAWGPSGTWEGVLRVVARDRSGARVSLQEGAFDGWFWSCGRPFLHGYLARFEARFPAVETTELWITVRATMQGESLVSEFQLMREDPARGEEESDREIGADASGMAERMRNPKPARVYAPRRLAELLHQQAPDIPNLIPVDYYEQYEGFDRYPSSRPVVLMDPLADSILVIPAAALGRTTRLLQQQGWAQQTEFMIGPWTGIRVTGPQRAEATSRLYWTEGGAFLAAELFPAANRHVSGGVSLLSEPVWFKPGMALECLEIGSTQLVRGASAQLTFGWRCPPDINPSRLAVFVHFVREKQVQFQDDHIWLQDVSSEAIARQPDHWVFSQVRTVRIPGSIPPGTYSLRLGIYDRLSGRRLNPAGGAVVKNRAIRLPDRLTIQ